MLPVISEHCFKLWENHYGTDTKGSAYKAIYPSLSKPSLENKNQHSTTIFRLSTGHCQLNHHLFRIGLHSDGLCDNCAVPETVDHFLRTCSKYREARQRFKQATDDLGITFETTQILQNAHLRKVSPLSSKKRENTFRQVVEVTWHYKTMMSESAINPPNNNNNNNLSVS